MTLQARKKHPDLRLGSPAANRDRWSRG